MNDSQPVPEAVFERDGHTCVRCGAERDDAPLHVYPVDGPTDDAVEELPNVVLATVCSDCRAHLDGQEPAWTRATDSSDAILHFLRDVTTSQGETIADVAEFAADATNGIDAEESAARRAYLDDRRRIRVAIAAIDRTLEVAADREWDGIDDEAADALAEVRALAEGLQRDLTDTVVLAETAVTATGRCHACLEPLDGEDRCGACGAPVRDTAAWETDDTVSLGALYAAVNDRLREASGRTGRLTERTGQLAELLVSDA